MLPLYFTSCYWFLFQVQGITWHFRISMYPGKKVDIHKKFQCLQDNRDNRVSKLNFKGLWFTIWKHYQKQNSFVKFSYHWKSIEFEWDPPILAISIKFAKSVDGATEQSSPAEINTHVLLDPLNLDFCNLFAIFLFSFYNAKI